MNSPDAPHRGRGRKRGNGEGTIAKRADGRYVAAAYVTRPDGSRGRKWIYGKTRTDVAQKLAELTQRVNAGGIIPTRTPTVSEYLDYWLKEVAEPKLRPTTMAKYRSTIEIYLRPGLGRQKLATLSVRHVQEFLNRRRAMGDSVPKLRMMREVLSSALGRATREELVTRNVAQLTTLPEEHRDRRTAWTASQARRFLNAARGDGAYVVFVLAMIYGLRRGEIAALHWENVDFAAGRLRVEATLIRVGGGLVRGPTKTRSGTRTLPLVAMARASLLAQAAKQRDQRMDAGEDWEESGYVFTTRSGRPIEPRNLSRSFDRIVAAEALPRIVFHDLRRTAATLLKDLGVPARDAQMILGHANINVTLGIYSEVFDSSVVEALELMEEALTDTVSRAVEQSVPGGD
ncbi:site-specific integrase [Pseudonocardia petroleophila]|uniref:Site-specific integrase n=1 Tax=Pseudonocardia petroleophila TaxID=37331 RepID=A0A7G7MCA2_9PSEU|nr:site-specific integrase [Pseudonocardia petroleophila]QNG50413.1 site-specific integrase [Pseudonocardia petroleophila]